MSVKVVNNPQTRKLYLEKTLEVLESQLPRHINFSAFGINLNGNLFSEVARDLRAGFTETNPPTSKINTYKDLQRYNKKYPNSIPAHRNLVVLRKPAGSKWGEYGVPINLFRFNLANSPDSPLWTVTVIHESVHAWLDMKMPKGIDRMENEAIAYIAEHFYGILNGILLSVQASDKKEIHTTARMIARTFVIGKIPPADFCDELIGNLRAFYGIDSKAILPDQKFDG